MKHVGKCILTYIFCEVMYVQSSHILCWFSVDCSFIDTVFLLQEALPTLTRNRLSRELRSHYSEVCEALKIIELLLGFLTMTGGDPKVLLVTYLKDMLKMVDHIDKHILKVTCCACSCLSYERKLKDSYFLTAC